MKKNLFIRTVFISALGHVSLFGFFSFSFGSRIPVANFSPAAFWGQVLPGSQTSSQSLAPRSCADPLAGILSAELQPARKASGRPLRQETLGAIKPQQPFSASEAKIAPVYQPFSRYAPAAKKEQVIIFHPLLPHDFFLYFTDRQVAHVELMFKAASGPAGRPAMIKRKISSGNLEADLLTTRYMSHYFFIRQAHFNTDSWQTIKIDLSARD